MTTRFGAIPIWTDLEMTAMYQAQVDDSHAAEFESRASRYGTPNDTKCTYTPSGLHDSPTTNGSKDDASDHSFSPVVYSAFDETGPSPAEYPTDRCDDGTTNSQHSYLFDGGDMPMEDVVTSCLRRRHLSHKLRTQRRRKALSHVDEQQHLAAGAGNLRRYLCARASGGRVTAWLG